MNLLDEAGDKLQDTLNAEGRSPGHVLFGAAVCLTAVGLSAFLAHRAEPDHFQREIEKQAGTKRNSLSQVWPALFSITTLAALRVWNAPASIERNRALGLWGLSQAFNAVWIAVSPRQRGLQAFGAIATAALTAAYAHQARKVDVRAGGMAAPMAGMALGNLITGELWRAGKPTGATMH